MKVIDLIEKYLEFKKIENKESTLYDKINVFDTHIKPYFKEYIITELSKDILKNWLYFLYMPRNGKKYSIAYINKIKCYMNNFLEWAKENYNIENELKKVPLLKVKREKKTIGFWEYEEFQKFITQKELQQNIFYYTLFNFAYYTGLRLGEIQAFSESNYTNNKIRIEKTYSSKTIDNTPYKITETKNYKSYEKEIPQELQEILQKYIEHKKTHKISSTYLFGGNIPTNEKAIRRKLDYFIAKTNLKRITPHGFRHSYVSLLVYLGESTKVIAELIGDTESQVIETYSHLYSISKSRAIQKIDSYIYGKKQ